ncbi:hypothetical protein B2J93_8341 [Marssonina coronariae]|uniref:Uncharacterized protein n=1 Tax=Diplocarpon coronariae TaxID=2795749 RepID=A0A218ZBK9_9HELO|nr:hypothetical protein B2J93_8341 [Marssonina coronariae]
MGVLMMIRQPPSPYGPFPSNNVKDSQKAQELINLSDPGTQYLLAGAAHETDKKSPMIEMNDWFDERFCDLQVIDVEIANFRFNAGTPITTKNRVSIGSLFIFDDQSRLGGLNMHLQATNIMRESLELSHIGVIFLGAAVDYTEDTNVALKFFKKYKVLATYFGKITTLDLGHRNLETKSLHTLEKSYPNGNV